MTQESGKPSIREAIESNDAIVDRVIAQLDRATRPMMDGQPEFTRLMTTLSSGALVLSISLVQLTGPRIQTPRVTWTIPCAWILFGAVVALAAFRVKWVQEAQSFFAILEGVRTDIASQVQSEQTIDHEYFDRVIDAAMKNASTVSMKHIRYLDRSQTAMAWMFAIGILELLAFAIANLSIGTHVAAC